jgi:hypothetical protein
MHKTNAHDKRTRQSKAVAYLMLRVSANMPDEVGTHTDNKNLLRHVIIMAEYVSDESRQH